MKMKLQLFTIGILLSINVFADGYLPEPTSLDQPWSVIASVGYGKYPDAGIHHNSTGIGRLALANELMLSGDIALGLEFGVQSGNRLHLNIPQETLTVIGWLPPVKSNLGPMLDLMVTAKSDPLYGSAFFAQLKGGVAYRYWQFDNQPINELTQLAGEIQAGFGYPITALASLNLLYQGVFGSSPNIELNTITKTGSVSNIPALHAILLGLSVNL